MTNFNIERKNYSKLTAQIARNMVKKKILEIRTRGARAADELIDDFVQKKQKNNKKPSFTDEIVPIIERNRAKWRNFIIEIAGRFDAEALATVGVNFIYGGLLTSSVGNVGWASVVTVQSGDAGRLAEILTRGRNRGSFVWILRGNNAFSPETLKTLRYFPEYAFLLVADRKIDEREVAGAKNILFLIKNGEKSIQKCNIPYVLVGENDPIFNFSGQGSGKRASGISPREAMRFLESPTFPVTIDSFSDSLDSVECLISGGREGHIPYYFA